MPLGSRLKKLIRERTPLQSNEKVGKAVDPRSQTKVRASDPAKVIVAIDFGTTYSGFSFLHTEYAESHPDNFLDGVEGFDVWPSQDKAGARPYFKTLTGLLYLQNTASDDSEYKLKAWGWAASVEYNDLLKKAGNTNKLDGRQFYFITKFKLALAGQTSYGEHESYGLPQGFTAERVIADYLRELSTVIDAELRKRSGGLISRKDIKWCLTVPAMWDDVAKQQMKQCAQRAGLVRGSFNSYGEASPHPIVIVLEPEAASAYGLHYLKKTHTDYLATKRKILIVDAGGGTVDLALHETVNSGSTSIQVKEICSSIGGLCGSTFVDIEFYRLLVRKIKCYQEYVSKNPSVAAFFRNEWEGRKISFEGTSGCQIDLPAGLSKYWEKNCKNEGLSSPAGYDELEITLEEMLEIFDCNVGYILKLIEEHLSQVERGRVDALLLVGGFSGSEYLRRKVHEKFDGKVDLIIHPPHVGRAVVNGAVAYGCLGTEIVTARISRKTYGVDKAEPPDTSLIFDAFVRKGEELSVEHCVKKRYSPIRWRTGQTVTGSLDVLSTTNRDPRHPTDRGVVKEYTFTIDYPAMNTKPLIEVCMFFGRTSIEVTAVGVNFESDAKITLIMVEAEPGHS